jgi:hypothetical protein
VVRSLPLLPSQARALSVRVSAIPWLPMNWCSALPSSCFCEVWYSASSAYWCQPSASLPEVLAP